MPNPPLASSKLLASICLLILLPAASAQWSWSTLGGDMTGILAGSTDGVELAVDASGNAVVVDTYNHCIRKVTAGGAWSVIGGQCGPSNFGYSDAGLGLFNSPGRVACTSDGSTVCVMQTAMIRCLSGGVWATQALPSAIVPFGVALDSAGSLYFTSNTSSCVLKGVPQSTNGQYAWSVIGGVCGTAGYADGSVAGSLFYQVRSSLLLLIPLLKLLCSLFAPAISVSIGGSRC